MHIDYKNLGCFLISNKWAHPIMHIPILSDFTKYPFGIMEHFAKAPIPKHLLSPIVFSFQIRKDQKKLVKLEKIAFKKKYFFPFLF